VLERGDGDEAAELDRVSMSDVLPIHLEEGETYVLLHVLLASVHGGLTHLEAELRSGVVHEAAKRGVRVVGAALLRHAAALLCVAIAVLRLRGRLRGRW
jgi:hypothetical protein